jgi:alginate O-acetyltransferase complex protein AlgI
MAIGLGKRFNINIPGNFYSPYRSESITEFWRKWHITLGRALSAYVYRPLGGNRKGILRTCINLFLTFLVSGIWHGAAWTFVLWGVLHGVCSVAERLAGDRRKAIPKPIRIFITFMIVNALWVLFRAEDISQTMTIYRGMVDFANVNLRQLDEVMGHTANINFPVMFDIAYIGCMVVSLLGVVFGCKNSAARLERYVVSNKTAVTAAALFAVAFLCLSRESVFIYFNF